MHFQTEGQIASYRKTDPEPKAVVMDGANSKVAITGGKKVAEPAAIDHTVTKDTAKDDAPAKV